MNKRSYKYDPVEDSEEYRRIEGELHEKIVAEMGGELNRGNAYLYVRLKKEILRRDYGIEWRSPQELNPHIFFN